jgi:zinc and cadmium transporter
LDAVIPLAWITVGGLLMSAIALVGSLTLVLQPAALQRLILPMVSLAAGTLLGGAFFHMIPAGAATIPSLWAGTWILAGFAAFLGLEELLHWHHCRRAEADCRKPMTYLILVGDALHNFLGGLGVASTFLINPTVGMMAWLAAAAHEVPQELGDFGVLVHGGWPRGTALRWNFLSGLTFLVGALLAYAVSFRIDVAPLVLLGAGNFIYIGASDLVPEMRAHRIVPREALQLFGSFAVGAAAMLLLALIFRR